jgi:arylformamidase
MLPRQWPAARRLLVTLAGMAAALAVLGWHVRAASGSQRAADELSAPNMRVIRDVAYGSDPSERFDVYAPAHASGAPVIFMVHGGGWRIGDKAMGRVVENKVARWVPKGFIVVSVNYRMLPSADPIEQARDVARALAAAQRQAASWGGDRASFILVGHSAGAHIVALLSASPQMLSQAGAEAPLGTVLLDSAALDVVEIMQAPHFPLYTQAFGRDPAFWRAASPYHQWSAPGPPTLAVCSSRRERSCWQAHRFVEKVGSLGGRAAVHEENLSHEQINELLGEPGAYTDAVEAFLATLGPSVARTLASR